MKISTTIRKSSVFAAACGLMLTAATSQANSFNKHQTRLVTHNVGTPVKVSTFDQYLRDSMVVESLGDFSGLTICSIPQNREHGTVCTDGAG